eukprot:7425769-Alexandrium_andersonii.AAC.1
MPRLPARCANLPATRPAPCRALGKCSMERRAMPSVGEANARSDDRCTEEDIRIGPRPTLM